MGKAKGSGRWVGLNTADNTGVRIGAHDDGMTAEDRRLAREFEQLSERRDAKRPDGRR